MGSTPAVGTISGSRAAAVVGLNPFQTQVSIWQDIQEELYPGFNTSRGYKHEFFRENATTRWGYAFEDSIIQLSEKIQGREIGHREDLFQKSWTHRHYITGRGWIEHEIKASCHVDGIYDGGTIHEGKTTGIRYFRTGWGDPEKGRLPAAYAIQIQHQMMCTGSQEAILSVLVFPKSPDKWEEMGWEIVITQFNEDKLFCIQKKNNTLMQNLINPFSWAEINAQQGFFHQYHVKANHEAQAALKAAYADFWSRYVIPKIPPPCRAYEDVKRLFVEPKGTVIATPEIESLCREYSAITKEIGASGSLGKRKNTLKRLLVDEMKRADQAVDHAEREKTIFVSSTGAKLASFDGKTFRG